MREQPPSENEELKDMVVTAARSTRANTLRPRSAIHNAPTQCEPRPLRYKRQKLGGEGNLGIIDVIEAKVNGQEQLLDSSTTLKDEQAEHVAEVES